MLGDESAADALSSWGVRGKGRVKQVVVSVSEVLKPAAYVAHMGAPPAPPASSSAEGEPPASSRAVRATMEDVRNGGGDQLVLWDVDHVRLASDWRPPPAAAAPSTNFNAYNDDAQFYAYPRPSHVVYGSGKMLAYYPPSVNIVLNRCMPKVPVTLFFVDVITLHRHVFACWQRM